METFWDEIIKPIFLKKKVRSIVEIGCESGKNTFKLLNYCSSYNADLLSIDPLPLFDTDSLEKENRHFKMIKDFSLNALPKIKDYDAILIDGDHNWYTVYHELKLIEKNFFNSDKCPIIFLHDTSWPYGRRDMYYFPESIPILFRKKYAKKSILHGFKELINPELNLEKNAINKELNNALYEGGEKNGVLTAIEDFLRDSEIPYSFHNITPHFGLGILYKKNHELEVFIDGLIKK